MSKKYRVTTGGLSFIVTVTEVIGECGIFLLVFICLFICLGYMILASPFMMWPMLYDELQMAEDGSNTYFWLLVFAQAALASWRALVLSKRDKSTFFLELLLESVFFYLAFEMAVAASAYFGLRGLTDPSLIQQATEGGYYDIDFFTVLKNHLSTDLSSPLAAAFLAYMGGAIPTVASCIVASILRPFRRRG